MHSNLEYAAVLVIGQLFESFTFFPTYFDQILLKKAYDLRF